MRPKIDEAFAMNQAIIFDMDGTLWDSAANVAESWNEAVKKEGYDYHFTKDDIMSVMGKTMDQIGDILFSNLQYFVYLEYYEQFLYLYIFQILQIHQASY